MSSQDAPSELPLTVSQDEAVQAILAALPKDAVVRDEDDGVGRFAGQRTVVIIGRSENRLMLFEGTWGSLKPRIDEPQVEVTFDTETKGDGVVARLAREEPQPKNQVSALLGDLINSGLTVAVLMVGYFWIRELPIDVPLTVTVSVLGGLAWTAVTFMLPKSKDHGLEGRVRSALEPLVAKPKSKPKSKSKSKSKEAPEDDSKEESKDNAEEESKDDSNEAPEDDSKNDE